ncbi:hypothetical protein GF356_12065 [candidate division GN15 bacterium]|nr:hypothetical protein [candidate division GN15 bacterium]
MTNIRRLLLLVLLPALALMLVMCGGDDDDSPTGPDPFDPGIVLPGGVVYKGEVGSSGLTPQFKVGVADVSGALVEDAWVILELVRGDGTLADSVQTGSDGYATLDYVFSDTLGHAEVRLVFRGIADSGVAEAPVDTVEVRLRANLLKPGDEAVKLDTLVDTTDTPWDTFELLDTTTIAGQGEYIIFDDTYGSVKLVDGLPASVDIHPLVYILYANYEAAKGVVIPIEEAVLDEIAQDFEPVLGVIVNSKYEGTTAEGIGIGSDIAEFRAAYGQPDSIELDVDPAFDPTHAIRCKYNEPEMIFWCDTLPDTNAFEIHFYWKPQPIELGADEGTGKVRPGSLNDAGRPKSSLKEVHYQWRERPVR